MGTCVVATYIHSSGAIWLLAFGVHVQVDRTDHKTSHANRLFAQGDNYLQVYTTIRFQLYGRCTYTEKFRSLYVSTFHLVIKDFLSSGKIAEALSAKGAPFCLGSIYLRYFGTMKF